MGGWEVMRHKFQSAGYTVIQHLMSCNFPKNHNVSMLIKFPQTSSIQCVSRIYEVNAYSGQNCSESLLSPLSSSRLPSCYGLGTSKACDFFDWALNQCRGMGGRRLDGIKSANTLGTYWKVFRLVHERATGEKIEGKINRKMHRVGSGSCLPAESCPNYYRSEGS